MPDLVDLVEKMENGEIVEGELSEEEVAARKYSSRRWALLRNAKDKARWKKIHQKAWDNFIERLRMKGK